MGLLHEDLEKFVPKAEQEDSSEPIELSDEDDDGKITFNFFV